MPGSVKHTSTDNIPTYEEIFIGFWHPLKILASRILGDTVQAEDIVMDVFVKYWPRQHDFLNRFAAWSYLAVSTKNACLNYRRQTKRNTQQMALLCYGQQWDENVLEHMVREEEMNQACSIVAGLPAECRRVFILCYLKGIKEETVALQRKVSHHTIRNQKVRGLEMFRERYHLFENNTITWKDRRMKKEV